MTHVSASTASTKTAWAATPEFCCKCCCLSKRSSMVLHLCLCNLMVIVFLNSNPANYSMAVLAEGAC